MSPEDRPIHPPRDPLNEREPVVVPRSQVTAKTALTVCAVVLAVAAATALVLHSLLTLTLAVTSALLAVALQHGVSLLQRWGLSRRAAVGLVVGALVGAVAGTLLLVIPEAFQQGREFIDNGPEYLERLRKTPFYRWAQARFDLEKRLPVRQGPGALMGQAAGPLLAVVTGALAGFTGLVTVLFLAVFMLLYGRSLVRATLAEALPAHRERYERVLQKLYVSVGGYLSGLGLLALINAACASLFLAVVGVPYFLPLGLLSGLGSTVPLVGAAATGTFISLVTLLTCGVADGAMVAAYVTLYQAFENHALGPVIYRKTVELNPLVTLLGVILFAELAGVVGAFLAVPLVGAMQIVLRELLLLRRERLNLPLSGDVASQVPPPRPERPLLWRRPRNA